MLRVEEKKPDLKEHFDVVKFYSDFDNFLYISPYYLQKATTMPEEEKAKNTHIPNQLLSLPVNKAYINELKSYAKLKSSSHENTLVELKSGGFSNRNTIGRDHQGNEGIPGIMSSVPTSMALQKRVTGDYKGFDTYTVEDTFYDVEAGSTFTRLLGMVETDPNKESTYLPEYRTERLRFFSSFPGDSSKIVPLYAYLHRTATEHRDKKVLVIVGDDLKQEVLLAIKEFFTKHKELLPPNVTLRLNHQQHFDPFSKPEKYHPMRERFADLKGEAQNKIDENYEFNILKMYELRNLINGHQNFYFAKLILNGEDTHWHFNVEHFKKNRDCTLHNDSKSQITKKEKVLTHLLNRLSNATHVSKYYIKNLKDNKPADYVLIPESLLKTVSNIRETIEENIQENDQQSIDEWITLLKAVFEYIIFLLPSYETKLLDALNPIKQKAPTLINDINTLIEKLPSLAKQEEKRYEQQKEKQKKAWEQFQAEQKAAEQAKKEEMLLNSSPDFSWKKVLIYSVLAAVFFTSLFFGVGGILAISGIVAWAAYIGFTTGTTFALSSVVTGDAIASIATGIIVEGYKSSTSDLHKQLGPPNQSKKPPKPSNISKNKKEYKKRNATLPKKLKPAAHEDNRSFKPS